MAALLPGCTMNGTKSSIPAMTGTSLVVALFPLHRCTMRDTNSSLNSSIGTPLMTALFTQFNRSMCGANSSVHDVSGASLSATFLSNPNHQAVFKKLLLGVEIERIPLHTLDEYVSLPWTAEHLFLFTQSTV
jgi:hypothetical protein